MTKSEKYPVKSRIVSLNDFLDPESGSFKELNIEHNYTVPYYQRPYEWGWNDKQLKGLFDTIIGTSSLDDDFDDPSFDNRDYIVFGTIQLNESISENGRKTLEIIDGQQRLTSFWLFIKAIEHFLGDTSSLAFDVNNQISDIYNEQLSNVSYEKNCSRSKNKYNENYSQLVDNLKKVKDDYEKNNKKIDFTKLRKLLLSNVLFSLMITSYENKVEKTIELFNSLNTKGLDLDIKDVFKIKYYEFLKRNCLHLENSKIFNDINSAYENCKNKQLDEIYHIEPNDLIDTFKLWIVLNDIIEKDDKSYLSKKIKSSPQQFFVDSKYGVFEEYKEYKSLKTFSDISITINKTQKLISEMDQNSVSGYTESTILNFSYELLKKCGYGYFRNLFFVFTYAIMQNTKKDLDENDIYNALKVCERIWKICSIAKVRDLRVKDVFFTSISENIAIPFIKSNTIPNKALKTVVCGEDFQNYMREFKHVMDNNVYSNRQGWFFIVLSYIQDITNGNYYENKKRLFYPSKDEKYDIEHIISQVSNNCNEIKNLLGNLVFLKSNINKSLGGFSKDIYNNTNLSDENKMLKDFHIKTDNTEQRQNYRTENANAAINEFLLKVDNLTIIGQNDIVRLIKEREKSKKDFINSIYSDAIGEI